MQRVKCAEVEVEGRVVGQVEVGLLTYVGVFAGDHEEHARRLAEKVANLRIFNDDTGKLNLNVRDARGGVLAVPNFTLAGDARKGRRPAFTDAAPPALAQRMFDVFVEELAARGCVPAKGEFGAHMTVRSVGDGPVNIVLDVPDSRDVSQPRRGNMEIAESE